ncbi:MAG: hypothetical protein ACI9OJ_001375 [Myxococcota bacterium]|jgi:hypothetical protein
MIRSRWLPFAVLFASAAGFASGCNKPETKESPIPGPEQYGTFLDEPADVPPDPLVPEQVEIRLRVADPLADVVARATERFGAESLWLADDAEVAAFLNKNRAWYAPLDQLKAATTAGPDALKTLAPVSPLLALAMPPIRIPIPEFGALKRQDALALRTVGGRGNLVLWFPVMTMRQRLTDGGTTGMWRGITRLRDQLAGEGPKVGGTPVFLLAAIGARDVPLLDARFPSGYDAVVTRNDWLGSGAELARRKTLFFEATTKMDSPKPKPPTLGDLPKAWTRLFTAPNGAAVAYLVPKQNNAASVKFQNAVEALVPLVRQGGEAWILIGLPLAQKHKPAIH